MNKGWIKLWILLTLILCVVSYFIVRYCMKIEPEAGQLAAGGAVCLFLSLVISLWVNASRSRKSEKKEQERQQSQTAQMRIMAGEAAAAADLITDPELHKKACVLAEDFRYSDPVSPPELSELEDRIRKNIGYLKEAAEDGNRQAIEDSLKQTENLLKERNNKCKALK